MDINFIRSWKDEMSKKDFHIKKMKLEEELESLKNIFDLEDDDEIIPYFKEDILRFSGVKNNTYIFKMFKNYDIM